MLPLGIDGRNDRHAGTQLLGERGAGIQCDLDGDALDHLGEIARGIVGRQQREFLAARRGDAVDVTREVMPGKVSTSMVAGWPGRTLVSCVSL